MTVDLGETNGHHQVGNRKENGSDLTGAHQEDPDILINSCLSNDLVKIEQGQIIKESEEEKDAEMKSGGEDELQLVVIQADIESSIAEKQGQRSSINTDPYNVGEICMIGNDSEIKSVSVACEKMTLVPLEEEDRQVKKCDPEKGEDGSSNSDFLIENGEHCESVSGLDKSQKTTNERVPEYKIRIKTPLVENINEIENVSTERVGSVDIDTSGKVDVCNIDPVVLTGEKFEIDQDMGGLRKIVDRKVLDNLNKECVNQEDSCHSIYSNIDYIPEKEKYTQLKNLEDFEKDQVPNQSDIGSNLAGKHEQRSSNNEDIDEIDTINKENEGDFPLDQLVADDGENSTLLPTQQGQVLGGMDTNLGLGCSSNEVNKRPFDVTEEEPLPSQKQMEHKLHFGVITEHSKTTLLSHNESVESESLKETSGCLQKEFIEYVGFSDINVPEETVSQKDFLSDMIIDFKLEGKKDVLQPSDQLVEESVSVCGLGDVNSVVGKLDNKMAVECTDDPTEHGNKEEDGQLEKKDEEVEEDGVGLRRGSVGSKGRWGQRSSVKKKKKRKIL